MTVKLAFLAAVAIALYQFPIGGSSLLAQETTDVHGQVVNGTEGDGTGEEESPAVEEKRPATDHRWMAADHRWIPDSASTGLRAGRSVWTAG